MNALLHYAAISEFKREFYKDVLTEEHIKPQQIHLDTLSFPDGGKDQSANFWGYELEKNGVKYLLPAKDSSGKDVKLRELLPVKTNHSTKVASRGTVYYMLQSPTPVRLKPEKTMSFRELVDTLAMFGHSNPQHQKLAWFMGLSQVMDRANYRIATPPGFGKDSIVDIMGSLLGKCATVESPTLAKLEERSVNLKWLAINEVVDLTPEAWKIIEQFLLAAGAHKPTVTKHSRAFGGVGEELDISQFSISIMYNDIDQYPDSTKYLDFVAKGAVLDRFPPFRLWGRYTEDFNSIRSVDVSAFVKEHWEDYRKILYALTYYKQNLSTELHHYDMASLMDVPERWKTNIGRLLKVIDLYCATQEEFSAWVAVVNGSVSDYKAMLSYPTAIEKSSKKLPKKEHDALLAKARAANTFGEKLAVLKGVASEADYAGSNTTGFW